MTVSIDNGILRVVLSEAETIHYHIDDIFFGEDTKEAKAALKGLLKYAAKTVDFTPDALRFLIEIYPDISGGCEVLFMPTHPKSGKRLRAVGRASKRSTLIAEFSSSEAVLSVCERLYMQNIKTDSRLFKFKGKFRLILRHSSETEAAVKEYTRNFFTSPIELAKTTEYGKEICREAVEKIGRAMQK